jgi:hypothetical protein
MAARLGPTVAVGLAILLSGCGGGSQRLSRSQFVDQANAICVEYEKKVSKVMAGIQPGNEAQIARAIDRALPVIRDGNAELRALKPPKELRQRFDRWLRTADEEVAGAEALRDAIRKRDPRAERTAFGRLRSTDARQDRLARGGLGLSRCASTG